MGQVAGDAMCGRACLPHAARAAELDAARHPGVSRLGVPLTGRQR